MTEGYVRTRITRLKVSGYRSLYDVELTDIPDIAVFHGKNGTGKSNLMTVPGLMLRWAYSGFPSGNEPLVRTYSGADKELGVRPSDFSYGREPTAHFELDVTLGTAANRKTTPVEPLIGSLHIKYTLRNTGDTITLWCSGLSWNGDPVSDPSLRDQLLRTLKYGALLLHYPAYRRVGRRPASADDNDLADTFQGRMFAVHIDSDISRRRQLPRLARRLTELGTFPSGGDIELSPVMDHQFNEPRLFVSVPGVGDIPLENLGSGQQQLIMMAADALVDHRPIVLLEEPEAHLHAELMEAFAKFLRLEAESTGDGSPIDQVWLSTHHHAFAIAPKYYEVTHDSEHGTMVEQRDRADAAQHWYEPGPLWEALRAFANSTSPDTVVMHDSDGHPITAGRILESIDGDRQHANDFAAAATRTIVSRFRKRPVQAQ